MNTQVNWFFDKQTKWQDAYLELREIVLACELTELLKWGCPCYTYENENVVLMHGFKDYCALLFMQGALLKDTQKILVQQTENVQSARQIRFTIVDEVIKNKTLIKSYIKEAIEISKAGLKVELKKTNEYKMPQEFQIVLDEMPDLKTAFESLTPGRQRGYLLFFLHQNKPRLEKTELKNIFNKF
jgi:uncharacterized protein YdeI (YjbR/CyaY-like superfamily)